MGMFPFPFPQRGTRVLFHPTGTPADDLVAVVTKLHGAGVVDLHVFMETDPPVERHTLIEPGTGANQYSRIPVE